ncbi:uncharacterized protein BCN122_I0565 [Burkholderia cenocepacia]|nr:uncharacterized protein BCN122_I0565 [Burkholderia cenocepacia]
MPHGLPRGGRRRPFAAPAPGFDAGSAVLATTVAIAEGSTVRDGAP